MGTVGSESLDGRNADLSDGTSDLYARRASAHTMAIGPDAQRRSSGLGLRLGDLAVVRYKTLSPSLRGAVRGPRPTQRRDRRIGDWIATAIIALLVPAMVIPFLFASGRSAVLTAQPTEVGSGSSTIITGTGLPPHQRGMLVLDGNSLQLGTYRTDSHGAFTVAIVVPRTVGLGQHRVSANEMTGGGTTGTGKAKTAVVAASVTITVVALAILASPSPTATTTPTSGSSSTLVPSPASTVSLAPTATPVVASGTPSPTITPSPDPVTDLMALITDVTAANAYRYGLRDSAGSSMDTLKVIRDSAGRYLGVYHTLIGGAFHVKLATSSDLLTWTYRTDLDMHASQPTIAATSDGGYLLAEEADNNGLVATSATWLRFRHYASFTSLLAAAPDDTFNAPHTLVSTTGGAEGTPNIYSASLSPDLSHSVIDIGFHYFKDAFVDRQARGTLVNFSAWSTGAEPQIDSAITTLGVAGNIGDRDSTVFDGARLNIHEGQLTRGDWSSWRVFLYNQVTGHAVRLPVRTHKGSVSFANPSYSILTGPTGTRVIVVTLFLPVSGAAAGEAGELLYFRQLP